MSKTPVSRTPAPAAPPEPIIHKSLGLSALLQQLEGRAGLSILDLGPACGTNIEFWSRFEGRIYVEGLYQGLRPILSASADSVEEDAPSPFPELLPYGPDTHFDVILAWDLFNYLPQRHLEALVAHLASFCRAGTYVFALLSVLQQMPAEPNLYKIVDNERMVYDSRTTETKPCPRYQPRDVNRLMSGFKVSSSFLLRHGVQEYVFIYEGIGTVAGATGATASTP